MGFWKKGPQMVGVRGVCHLRTSLAEDPECMALDLWRLVYPDRRRDYASISVTDEYPINLQPPRVLWSLRQLNIVRGRGKPVEVRR
jgi:hypothetical protein